jgi:hypothetical protein
MKLFCVELQVITLETLFLMINVHVVLVFCHFVGSFTIEERYIAYLPGNHGDMQKIV